MKSWYGKSETNGKLEASATTTTKSSKTAWETKNLEFDPLNPYKGANVLDHLYKIFMSGTVGTVE